MSQAHPRVAGRPGWAISEQNLTLSPCSCRGSNANRCSACQCFLRPIRFLHLMSLCCSHKAEESRTLLCNPCPTAQAHLAQRGVAARLRLITVGVLPPSGLSPAWRPHWSDP